MGKKSQAQEPISEREEWAVACSGVGFALAGIAGFALLPALGVIWLVLLAFGLGAVMQVAVWRWRRRSPPRPRLEQLRQAAGRLRVHLRINRSALDPPRRDPPE